MDAQERTMRLLWTFWTQTALESSNSNDPRVIEARRAREKKFTAWGKKSNAHREIGHEVVNSRELHYNVTI